MNLYLSNKGETVGPYSIEQIQTFLEQDLVATTDQVWADGWSEWIPIGNVPGIGFQPSNPEEGSLPNGTVSESPSTSDLEEVEDIKTEHTDTPATSDPIHQKTKIEPLKRILPIAGVCCLLVVICWIIGASYSEGVQNGASSAAQAGFKQGVQAGVETQSRQDVQTVNDVETTLNAIQSQQDSSTTDDSANAGTQNQGSNPASQLYIDENHQIRIRPSIIPQGFDNN